MRKSIIVAATLAASISIALTSASLASDLAAVRLRGDEQALFTNAVSQHLKDPYSAVFSNVVAFRDLNSRAVHVCGYVNAKNSFGGYAGNSIFYGMSSYGKDGRIKREAPFVTVDKDMAASFARKFCR